MKNSKRETLPFIVIALARQGNVHAINQILTHFEEYIIRLSQKTLFDEYGTPYRCVDEEIKRTLETRLITAILQFELA